MLTASLLFVWIAKSYLVLLMLLPLVQRLYNLPDKILSRDYLDIRDDRPLAAVDNHNRSGASLVKPLL
jgi:hypothetical protein